MKRILSFLLILSLTALVSGCGKSSQKNQQELIIFAASSMTETLNAIIEKYEADHPGIRIICNYDSSGTLKTQILEGAPCDLFISAGQKQMDQLDDILESSRLDLLENKITLVVPEGNPKQIENFDALAKCLPEGQILLAIGNSDVPVGQYTKQFFDYYGLSEEALASSGVLTYGTNVKEVTMQVREAAVDCGIVYATDAFSAALTVVDTANEEMCGKVIYPAAVIRNAENQQAAQDFLTYLTGREAIEIFEAAGFTRPADLNKN